MSAIILKVSNSSIKLMIHQVPSAELLAQSPVNEKLQDKLKAVATPDGQIAANNAISISKEAGFVISASDLAVKEDLSDEQLEAVTGGHSNVSTMAETGYIFTSIGTLGALPIVDVVTNGGELWKRCTNA